MGDKQAATPYRTIESILAGEKERDNFREAMLYTITVHSTEQDGAVAPPQIVETAEAMTGIEYHPDTARGFLRELAERGVVERCTPFSGSYTYQVPEHVQDYLGRRVDITKAEEVVTRLHSRTSSPSLSPDDVTRAAISQEIRGEPVRAEEVKGTVDATAHYRYPFDQFKEAVEEAEEEEQLDKVMENGSIQLHPTKTGYQHWDAAARITPQKYPYLVTVHNTKAENAALSTGLTEQVMGTVSRPVVAHVYNTITFDDLSWSHVAKYMRRAARDGLLTGGDDPALTKKGRNRFDTALAVLPETWDIPAAAEQETGSNTPH